MMSGRSLGHTGGTLDKLESIPGYRTDLSADRFRQGLREVGYAMIGQSEDVVPADRRMYALRDVTGTVESIPLITASIMSKKFAEGAQGLVFDVKTGAGAFMRERDQARALARSLVDTGRGLGRKVAAVITDMDQPLGRKVGNFLEVEESIACLRGTGPAEEVELTCRLAGWMLHLGDLGRRRRRHGAGTAEACRRLGVGTVPPQRRFPGRERRRRERSGNGPARFPRPCRSRARGGYVKRIDAHAVGIASVVLGAGRSRKEDTVLPGVGIVFPGWGGAGLRG